MSERDDLKARAEDLKLDFAANISTVKLAELVAEAEAKAPAEGANKAPAGQDTIQAGEGEGTVPPETVTAPSGDDGSNSFEEALAHAAASKNKGAPAVDAGKAAPAFHGRKFMRVLGPAKGFRRAGRAFGPKPVDIPLDELSKAEERALRAETRLITTYLVEGVGDK